MYRDRFLLPKTYFYRIPGFDGTLLGSAVPLIIWQPKYTKLPANSKEHFLFGASQASPACPSGQSNTLIKVSFSPWWNDAGSGAEVLYTKSDSYIVSVRWERPVDDCGMGK
jgi:hypothetical protein